MQFVHLSVIAEEMGSSKQYVYITLNKAMRKIFDGFKREFEPGELTDFEVMVQIAKVFGVKKEKDFERFFADFPLDIRERVTKDSMNLMRTGERTLSEIVNYHHGCSIPWRAANPNKTKNKKSKTPNDVIADKENSDDIKINWGA